MDIITLIERIGVPMLFCLILIKQQQEKDKQMLTANSELLQTNAKLGNTIEIIVTDMNADVKDTNEKVSEIADILRKGEK